MTSVIWTGLATVCSYGHIVVQSMVISVILPPTDNRLLRKKVSTNASDNSCFLNRTTVENQLWQHFAFSRHEFDVVFL